MRTFTLAELAGCRTDVLGSPGSDLPTRPAPRPARIATVAAVLEYARRSGAEVNLEIKNVPTDSDNDYDFISPEWPVSGDYVRRAHAMRLDVAPFTLNSASEVRAARAAGVDAVITDDPLMAGRAFGLRPPRHFAATAFIRGRRLFATGDVLTPRGVPARRGCRGVVTMHIVIGTRRPRTARGRLNRNCELLFSTRRTPARLGAPLVTISFEGNSRVLPRMRGPFAAGLAPPVFNP